MTGNEVRKKFLDFFASKKHTIVESDSLVPKNDPTVLFTTAGMQQFKRQFLGHIDDYTRAASSQKCLRTDDLDEVGKTDFHHTFFEMLGNFSFGDYFKKEAIAWSWEFLTNELGISKNKLWISIYKDDKEAEEIWLKEIGIDPKKLVKLGDKSNFWPANAKKNGPNGPCGPCSEIFYDYGINKKCKSKKCNPDCSCGRFSEIWNLVFTQYDRKEGGTLEPLPNKSIDTGMGLERLVAVMQGTKNNYKTNLFQPILEAIDKETNAHSDKYSLDFVDKCIIADHIRAIVFGISDGVPPSNTGRGYVIKKLIIDATDKMIPLERRGARLYKLVSVVCNIMKDHYQELDSQKKQDRISSVIKKTQESYLDLREKRMPQLIQEINQIVNEEFGNDKQIIDRLGRLMFKYRDTFGLTESALEEALNISGIPKDEYIKGANQILNDLMKDHQAKSRASSKMTGDVFTGTHLDLNVPKTEFMGYDHCESKSTILALYADNKKTNMVSDGDHVTIILDRTPFYAEAGGQIGDSGDISAAKGRIQITDTQKIDDITMHTGTVESGQFKINEPVNAAIDLERRLSIMRHHTATHLLQTALRNVLGSHVQQQGSLVAQDRLRFDFTHHKAITRKELVKIEQYVNERILNCDTVVKDLLPIEQARKSGALAFFAEKYGKVVRVVSISDYSKEFCGGTHLDSTGQIGLFKIVSESAIAQGIRRLEAKTGTCALEHITEQENQLTKISQILKAPAEELVDRLNVQSNRLKKLEKELEQFRFESIKGTIDTILKKAENINGTQIINHSFKNVNMELLRKISDLLRQKTKSAVILLGTRTEDNASLLLTVSDDLIKKGIKANEMIKEISPLINGSGGGRPQLAQAGSKEVNKIDSALKQANQMIKEKIKS